jgi:predicted porin
MTVKYRKRTGIGMTAVAALSFVSAGTAHAQSSVSLYGLVDGGLIYASRTAGTALPDGQVPGTGHQFSFTDSGLSPSNFGLQGTEDLGGGLKAVFKLESGFSIANGGYNDSNGYFFGRQAYVGMSGPFGDVKAGLQYSPFLLQLYELDPRGLSQVGSSLMMYLDNLVTTGIFTPNALSYTSPVLWGFQGSALFSFGGVAGDFQNGRQYSASLKYDNGTWMVGASYFNAAASTGAALVTPVPSQLDVPVQGRQLGASYKIGKLTAKASFVNYKVGDVSNNVYGGGFDFLALSQLDLNAGVWYETQRHMTTNHSLLAGLGANYYLSRATTLYAQVAVVDNHGNMETGFSAGDADLLNSPTGTTTGATIGIRHTF